MPELDPSIQSIREFASQNQSTIGILPREEILDLTRSLNDTLLGVIPHETEVICRGENLSYFDVKKDAPNAPEKKPGDVPDLELAPYVDTRAWGYLNGLFFVWAEDTRDKEIGKMVLGYILSDRKGEVPDTLMFCPVVDSEIQPVEDSALRSLNEDVFQNAETALNSDPIDFKALARMYAYIAGDPLLSNAFRNHLTIGSLNNRIDTVTTDKIIQNTAGGMLPRFSDDATIDVALIDGTRFIGLHQSRSKNDKLEIILPELMMSVPAGDESILVFCNEISGYTKRYK